MTPPTTAPEPELGLFHEEQGSESDATFQTVTEYDQFGRVISRRIIGDEQAVNPERSGTVRHDAHITEAFQDFWDEMWDGLSRQRATHEVQLSDSIRTYTYDTSGRRLPSAPSLSNRLGLS